MGESASTLPGCLKSLPASFSLRSEAQRTEAYASPLRSLRPCWTAFLSILQWYSHLVLDLQAIEVLICRNGFSAACQVPSSAPRNVNKRHVSPVSEITAKPE